MRVNEHAWANDTRGCMIKAFKASGCARCHKRVPSVDWSELQIHHLGGAETRAMFPRNGSERLDRQSFVNIIAELLHCEVLCRDCHNEAHRNGHEPLAGQLELFAGNGSWHYA